MRVGILLLLSALSLVLGTIDVSGATPQWLDIFTQKDNKLRVVSRNLNDFPEIGFNCVGKAEEDSAQLYDSLSVVSSEYPVTGISIEDFMSLEFSNHVPVLKITTDTELDEIPSKTTYFPATMVLSTDSVEFGPFRINIRGRGNSTWNLPKKPYRIQFTEKTQLLDFPKLKTYEILANYLDNTLLRNTVAFKAAELLGIPFTNSTCAVDVWLNGAYRGSYSMTQKIGIGEGRVDIDEKKGILWEIEGWPTSDVNYKTSVYDLVISVRDPDLEEISAKLGMPVEEYLRIWLEDFEKIVAAVKSGNPWDVIDFDGLVDYALVQNFVKNGDFVFPCSVFAYKKSIDDKLHFGPEWDFDKAFNFSGMPAHHHLLYRTTGDYYPGGLFFKDLFNRPDFLEAFGKRWEYFQEVLVPVLLEFIDEEAVKVRVSAVKEGELFPEELNDKGYCNNSTETFDRNVEQLKQWILDHIDYINESPTFRLFYEKELIQ